MSYMNAPYAKLSIRYARKVKIAPVHSSPSGNIAQ